MMQIANCQLPIAYWLLRVESQIGNRQLAIVN